LNNYSQTIIDEITKGFNSIDNEKFEAMALNITNSKNSIIGIGAGRMGYSLKGFIMRLNHLGYQAFMLGDTNLPKVKQGDIIIVNTSSGETPSIKLFTKQAKSYGAQVCVVTANPTSTIGAMADILLCYKDIDSKQLMKTYHEQLTWLIFDAIAMLIFTASQKDKVWVENNHSILE
jgi:6-phospho-3-hexuloisomerase